MRFNFRFPINCSGFISHSFSISAYNSIHSSNSFTLSFPFIAEYKWCPHFELGDNTCINGNKMHLFPIYSFLIELWPWFPVLIFHALFADNAFHKFRIKPKTILQNSNPTIDHTKLFHLILWLSCCFISSSSYKIQFILPDFHVNFSTTRKKSNK